ncbi:MAG: zinc ribbon domain-containing protein [Candidatus Dormibacteraeota bacterium]|uniref:FmdB family transcriptional regulator n=1 Tax=Candidatus Aeolococcus gillhamiae TaxID=3127015 RepID=A0A2W6AV86_9BACT|nr:zinc ribbon domain-containing protein [Candidatus Dormibacteraeota bacterium]PZR81751.1 MAG: FmdB family transcriptional regulator [Candidatus Dormibacter sp. RRmetagenome_bin12]
MPIYGYRCQSCQGEFEVQQRMSDPSLAACPDCGGAGTRLFYPAGILFKGSGFYKTDSRSTAAAASASSDKPASETAADSTKPAAPAKESPAPAATPKPAESTKPAKAATD